MIGGAAARWDGMAVGSSERMVVVVGDITKLAVDAIVNAANPSLLGVVGWTGPSTGPLDRACSRNAVP